MQHLFKTARPDGFGTSYMNVPTCEFIRRWHPGCNRHLFTLLTKHLIRFGAFCPAVKSVCIASVSAPITRVIVRWLSVVNYRASMSHPVNQHPSRIREERNDLNPVNIGLVMSSVTGLDLNLHLLHPAQTLPAFPEVYVFLPRRDFSPLSPALCMA